MQLVTLHNGTEELDVLVSSIMLSLKGLIERGDARGALVVYELTQLARDRSHQLFGDYGEFLRGMGLVEPGDRLHDSIRNIVLSAVEDDELDLKLRNPIKEQ